MNCVRKVRAIPRPVPNSARMNVSVRSMRTTAKRENPSAFKMPISRVRSMTMVCMLSRTTMKLITMPRSEEHTSELQSRRHLVCRLLLEKKKHTRISHGAPQSTSRHYRPHIEGGTEHEQGPRYIVTYSQLRSACCDIVFCQTLKTNKVKR